MPYLVDGVANAEHVLPHPPLSPAVLLHQAQQHRATGLADALLLLICLVQMDLELGIGPISGWKSPEEVPLPMGVGDGGEEKGRTSVTSMEVQLRLSGLRTCPPPEGDVASSNQLPLLGTRHILCVHKGLHFQHVTYQEPGYVPLGMPKSPPSHACPGLH